MLRFSGELVSFLDLVEFESKQELLNKVKQVREDIGHYLILKEKFLEKCCRLLFKEFTTPVKQGF